MKIVSKIGTIVVMFFGFNFKLNLFTMAVEEINYTINYILMQCQDNIIKTLLYEEEI